MRATIVKDNNNVNKIGSASNPGLRTATLTRSQHRDRLAAKYKDRPAMLEELLDTLYGKEP